MQDSSAEVDLNYISDEESQPPVISKEEEGEEEEEEEEEVYHLPELDVDNEPYSLLTLDEESFQTDDSSFQLLSSNNTKIISIPKQYIHVIVECQISPMDLKNLPFYEKEWKHLNKETSTAKQRESFTQLQQTIIPISIDTILFVKSSNQYKPFAKIVDVIGPVHKPFYKLQFTNQKHLQEQLEYCQINNLENISFYFDQRRESTYTQYESMKTLFDHYKDEVEENSEEEEEEEEEKVQQLFGIKKRSIKQEQSTTTSSKKRRIQSDSNIDMYIPCTPSIQEQELYSYSQQEETFYSPQEPQIILQQQQIEQIEEPTKEKWWCTIL